MAGRAVRRETVVAAAFGAVQVIHLHWTKSSRGGSGARQRNAVPLRLDLPEDVLHGRSDELAIVESHWGEANDFAAPFHHRAHRVGVDEGFRYGCVSVAADSERLSVRYRYDRSHGGAPDRWFFNWETGYGESPTRTLLVAPGEWVRVLYNGRFSCVDTGNWWYEQVAVNVARYGVSPSPKVFTVSEPSRELRMLARLC